MGSICSKKKIYELKIYWGAISNDTEEWWKIWRGNDLTFQNWHEEFDEFWSEHWKISITCTLMGFFWTKYMFELKKSIGEFCLMALNIDAKFEGKLTYAFKNDMRNYSKFSPEHVWKSKNSKFDGILLSKVENLLA